MSIISEEFLKKFDPSKPVQTRDGKKVIIRSSEDDSLTAFVETGQSHPCSGGVWALRVYNINGKYFSSAGADSCVDLINIPTKVKKEGWVNIYKAKVGYYKSIAFQSGVYGTRIEADEACLNAHKNGVPLPVDTVKIKWEEGE